MSYFKNDKSPSCSDCDYARLQIPNFDRYSDPYCQKGHGKCEVDKLCGDFKPVTAVCGKCDFIRLKNRQEGFICIKKYVPVRFTGRICMDICIRQPLSVSFNGRTCDEFRLRENRIKELFG